MKVSAAITAALHVTGLVATESNSGTQKIRIIGFLFDNRLQWQFNILSLEFGI
jgi:hypothetical protein